MANPFDDIPGTRVFTARRARQGYWMNQFAMSLMNPESRAMWKADERAYLADWAMTDEQKEAILSREPRGSPLRPRSAPAHGFARKADVKLG